MNKKQSVRVNEFIHKINDVDKQNSKSQTALLYKERLALYTEFDPLTTGVEDMHYMRSRHREYGYGERVSKL